MAHRETVYECTFSLAGEEWTVVARAWDAPSARLQVLGELESAGLSHPSSMRVRRSAGAPLQHVEASESQWSD
jgi:hypothetical protein